jgi:hypothetical protein
MDFKNGVWALLAGGSTDYDVTPTRDGAIAVQKTGGSTIVEVFDETDAAIQRAIVLGTTTVTTTIFVSGAPDSRS